MSAANLRTSLVLLAVGATSAGCLYHRPPSPDLPHATLELHAHYAVQPGDLTEVVRVHGARLHTPPGHGTPRSWSLQTRVRPGKVVVEFDASFALSEVGTQAPRLPPGCANRASSVVLPGDCAGAPFTPQYQLQSVPLARCDLRRGMEVRPGEHVVLTFSFRADGTCSLCANHEDAHGTSGPTECETSPMRQRT